MISLDELKTIVSSVLQVGSRLDSADRDDVLLGGVPEFDSMAVVSLLTAFEEQYGIEIDDDEISAENFQTFGSLQDFLNSYLT